MGSIIKEKAITILLLLVVFISIFAYNYPFTNNLYKESYIMTFIILPSVAILSLVLTTEYRKSKSVLFLSIFGFFVAIYNVLTNLLCMSSKADIILATTSILLTYFFYYELRDCEKWNCWYTHGLQIVDIDDWCK